MFQKKSLGQNFLKSPKIVGKIAGAGDIEQGEKVLEIGPGEGILTKALLDKGAIVYAIEKDYRLIPIISEKFSKEIAEKKLFLIHGDILELSLSQIGINDDYKIIANIPYYITGLVIRKFLEQEKQPKTIVLLVQNEVADRICAKDGKESLLSISVKAYGDVKDEGLVKRGNFLPVPNVDSAILSIKDISKKLFIDNKIDEKRFFEIIKRGFAEKRKMLRPKMRELTEKNIDEVFDKLSIDKKIRAEKVDLKKWAMLAKEL